MTPSDELHLRTGLPAELRYLEAECARADWSTMGIHPAAEHWLQIHGWFRGMFGHLDDLAGAWRGGQLPAAAYRAQSLPVLQELLNHLHGHHNIESRSYFPAMARMEPRMQKGFDLLDRDHDAIEALMQGMLEAGIALYRAGEGRDVTPEAAALVEALANGGRLIERHLLDEEEIVVPVFTLRGDPFEHM